MKLVYMSLCLRCFKVFGWHYLDIGTYLRSDYNVLVKAPDQPMNSDYAALFTFSLFFLALYPFGVPLMIGLYVRKDFRSLQHEHKPGEDKGNASRPCFPGLACFKYWSDRKIPKGV